MSARSGGVGVDSRVLTDEELRALEPLAELMERADVNDRQRFEFRAFPLLACELLELALSRPKIRNPAAFALDRFRKRVAEARTAPTDLEAELGAGLSEEELERGLEFARSHGAPAPIVAELEAELERVRAA